MKISAIFLSLFIGISLSAQQIEIPSEQYPFYSVIEWKGMGAMLLNRDPSLNTKKVNLTLVGNNPTSIWMQSFNPNGKDFYYISSENARYVYFLDNLKPDMGKIYLHQLNSAGNVKSTSVILSSAIKKLGTYDLSEMELIDVVTTDKALVHIFRYHDVKEKKYIEMATFVTHHNLLVYASIIGEVSEISLKEGNYGYWKYIGFADEQILFAARDYQSRNSGWSVKKFTPKAVMSEAVFIHGSTDNFDKVQNTGFGSNGKSYLNTSGETESGMLNFINNQFYLTGIQSEGSNKTVRLKQLVEGEWKELNSFKMALDSKKTLEFANYSLNEGIGCKIGNTLVFLPFDPTAKPIQNPFITQFNTNPSRFIIGDKKELFAVSLADGNLFFDMTQLNKPGNVKFEFTKK